MRGVKCNKGPTKITVIKAKKNSPNQQKHMQLKNIHFFYKHIVHPISIISEINKACKKYVNFQKLKYFQFQWNDIWDLQQKRYF